MLIIRLARKGKKKNPIYRIIISEKTKDTQGDYLEALGHYNPATKETKLTEERIKYWLAKGAQLSATVNNLLIQNGLLAGKKIKKGRRLKKKDGKEDPEKKAEEPAKTEKKTAPAEESPAKKAEKPAEKPEKEETEKSDKEAPEKANEEKKEPEAKQA